jgi:xylulokinase
MRHLLGIDIGTSGAKTLLIDEKGKPAAQATFDYPNAHPKPLWSEQDPEDWWTAVIAGIRRVMETSRVQPRDVAGIGLSGQMHGACLLDKEDRVLRPAILWNDGRTAEECAEITRRAGGLEKLVSFAGNPALTGFTAPKILWVRKNEPDIFKKVRRVLLPKDLIRLRLTGEYATEVSDAAGTLLLDVRNRRWSAEILKALAIDESLLPKCFESFEISGRLTKQAADSLGLAPGTPVAGGGGDQAAGAVGNGITRAGVVSATLGTSGVVFAHSDNYQVDPAGRLHAFCHAVPGKWHLMGVVLSAGGALQWLRNTVCGEETSLAPRMGCDPYELMTAQAARAPLGCEGLMFLPYLTGERTPHADPLARGAFVGLTPRHNKGHLVRAVMEGVAFAMRDSLELIRGLGVPVNELRLSGGGARSELWRKIQADVYGCDVCMVTGTEGPAFGVALLAGVGTGIWPSVGDAVKATIKTSGAMQYDKKNHEQYTEAYKVWRDLYVHLKGDFVRQAKMGT